MHYAPRGTQSSQSYIPAAAAAADAALAALLAALAALAAAPPPAAREAAAELCSNLRDKPWLLPEALMSHSAPATSTMDLSLVDREPMDTF